MNALKTLSIVVTRPAHQATTFTDQLTKHGARVIALPTIAIEFRTSPLTVDEQSYLSNSDLWIFTSANAATGASRCGMFTYLNHARIACIGHATADALRRHGVEPDLVPEKNVTSEGLLNYLSDKDDFTSTTIVQGSMGRDLLRQALVTQGKHVAMIDVYQRTLPVPDMPTLAKVLDALPCTISISSNQGLKHLWQLIPLSHHEALMRSALVVNSVRCRDLAITLGHTGCIDIASPPGDTGQLTALLKRHTPRIL